MHKIEIYSGTFTSLNEAFNAIETLINKEFEKIESELTDKKNVNVSVKNKVENKYPHIMIKAPKSKSDKFFSVKGNVNTKKFKVPAKKKSSKKAVAVLDSVDFVDHFNA